MVEPYGSSGTSGIFKTFPKGRRDHPEFPCVENERREALDLCIIFVCIPPIHNVERLLSFQ